MPEIIIPERFHCVLSRVKIRVQFSEGTIGGFKILLRERTLSAVSNMLLLGHKFRLNTVHKDTMWIALLSLPALDVCSETLSISLIRTLPGVKGRGEIAV